MKALMGDASDNIPGVKGVGEKTAMALIGRYGSIDALYAAMPTPEMAPGTPAKPGVIKKLQEGEESARMSYDLATIRTNAPLDFDPEDNLRREVDNGKLYQLFLNLEFSKLIDKYHLTAPQGEGAPQNDKVVACTCTSEVVDSNPRVEELLKLWREADCVNVLALPDLDRVCVECALSPTEHHAALLFSDRLEGYNDFLKEFFSAEEIKKATHSLKALWRALLGEGISPAGFVFDTEVAAYLLAPTDGSYDLEKLGLTYYNQEFPKAATIWRGSLRAPGRPGGPHGRPHVPLRPHRLPPGDPHRAKRLRELGMWELYEKIELPLCRVLAEMEQEGFLIDRGALADFGEMLSGRIDQAQANIYAPGRGGHLQHQLHPAAGPHPL